MSDNQNYENEFSEEGFWEKVKNYAKKAGKEVIETALKMYYAAQDEDTPTWAKAIIYSALGYFILPIDVIPDIAPVVGYTDDLGVLLAAIASVAAHIKDEHAEKARKQIEVWFG